MRSVQARVLAGLLAAAFVAYGGPGILDLGFYHDDWAFLSILRFGPPGILGGASALAEGVRTILFRPATLALYPPLYAAFGLTPLPWQLTLLMIQVGIAFAIFRILLRFRCEPTLAALGALLALGHPSKDATMFWPVAMVNPLSFWLFLEGYLQALLYVEEDRVWRLAAALALLLLSFGLYDQTLLLFPAWAIGPGRPGARAKTACAAAGATAGLYLTWKFGLAPRWAGPFHQPVALSFSRLEIYLDGLDALFGQSLARHASWAAGDALRTRPLLCLAGAALPWLAARLPGGSRAAAGPLALVGASFVVLGYAPFLPSDYTPDGISLINRINLIPAAGVVLLAIAAASRAPRRFAVPVLCAAASLLLVVHAGFAGLWARSYRLQTAIRDVVLASVDQWPAERTLLVYIPERFVEGKGMVFDAHWDISGAVQLWTGDPNRLADMWSRRQEPLPDGLIVRGKKHPYSEFTILDVPNRRIAPASYALLRALPRT